MYSIFNQVDYDFDEAVEKTKYILEEEGFGVLTSIDVKSTLKQKLNVDYDDYVILGACNPEYAYKALQADRQIGLLLPCNVIVYEENDDVFVATIKPTEVMKVADNSEIEDIAKGVERDLGKVIGKL